MRLEQSCAASWMTPILRSPSPRPSTLWKLGDVSGRGHTRCRCRGRALRRLLVLEREQDETRTARCTGPSALAKIAAQQGMLMLVPPVGIGMGAYGYLKGAGGTSSAGDRHHANCEGAFGSGEERAYPGDEGEGHRSPRSRGRSTRNVSRRRGGAVRPCCPANGQARRTCASPRVLPTSASQAGQPPMRPLQRAGSTRPMDRRCAVSKVRTQPARSRRKQSRRVRADFRARATASSPRLRMSRAVWAR